MKGKRAATMKKTKKPTKASSKKNAQATRSAARFRWREQLDRRRREKNVLRDKASSKARQHVRVQLEYVLDLGRSFFEGPHEIAGLKDDLGGLIIYGLLHANPGLRARYELRDIKLVPASIKFSATPCDRRGR
jgi:hypothetical protein